MTSPVEAASCGYKSYHGNSLGRNHRGGALSGWEGGVEGGPLLLSPADAAGTLHPPAMLLSALNHPKSIIGSPTYAGAGDGGVDRDAPVKRPQGHHARVQHAHQPAQEHAPEPTPRQQPSLDASKPNPMTRVAFGVQGYVEELPPSFVQKVVLVGRAGLAATQMAWGATVQRHSNTTRLSLDQDILNSKVTYWTDNGAYYCYCNRWRDNKNATGGHYNTPMHVTIKALQAYHKSLGLHIDM